MSGVAKSGGGSAASSGVRLLKRDRLVGDTFGESKFALYEACNPTQRQDSPYVFVWLHGLDLYEFTESDAQLLHQRLGRRVICLVPRNPEDSTDGHRFIWGLQYTKAQNRNGCGFIFGELNTEYLHSMCGLVRQIRGRHAAEKVIVCGYSAGGFGALQLGSHAPELFNVVISVAGHGKGTIEEQAYGAPQPESSRIFHSFLQEHAPRLAMTAVIIVHSRRDSVSSFKDAEATAEAIQANGGKCDFVVVPDDMANSDGAGKKKKSKAGHSYYFYSLLNESSENVIHCRLREALSGGSFADDAEGGISQAAASLSGPQGHVCNAGQLVAEAQERLKANRTQATSAILERLKKAHGLSEEVELALRMLAPKKLQELGASTVRLKSELLQALDKNAYVFSLVSALDSSVEALVKGLLQMDAASDENSLQREEFAQVPDAAVVAKAQARLRYNKTKSDFPAIARLKADCGLTEEVELALKLLTPEHLAEVLAGWSDIKAKVRQKQDGGKFLISIISQLDPNVECLVQGILALESQGGGGSDADAGGGEEALAVAKARLRAPKGKAELAGIRRLMLRHGLGEEVELALRMLSSAHLREILAGEAQLVQKMAEVDDKGKLMLWLVSQLDPDVEALVQKILEIDSQGDGEEEQNDATHAVGEDLERVEQTHEEAIIEARSRLQANKSTTSSNAIASFRAVLGLGDEVELAMRMLVPAKLFKLTARKLALKRELASVDDRNQHVLSLISELDPSVEALVRRFLDMDSGAQEDAETGQARRHDHSRSPRRFSRRPPPRGSLAKQMPGWI